MDEVIRHDAKFAKIYNRNARTQRIAKNITHFHTDQTQ